MLHTAVENALTLKVDSLVMRTINTMSAATLKNMAGNSAFEAVTGPRAVNLLKMYNNKFSANLGPLDCLTSQPFLRYASMIMGLYVDRIKTISTLFNIGGKPRFTRGGDLKVVLLSEFKAAAGAYLQSDTYHEAYTALPESETVSYWQGSGLAYDFGNTSKIKVKIQDGDSLASVECTGVLGVMFDRSALGVCNLDRRTTTGYNPRAEFYTSFYKFDAGYFNDQNENFVVFYAAFTPVQPDPPDLQ
jgi:hypothetical protein